MSSAHGCDPWVAADPRPGDFDDALADPPPESIDRYPGRRDARLRIIPPAELSKLLDEAQRRER